DAAALVGVRGGGARPSRAARPSRVPRRGRRHRPAGRWDGAPDEIRATGLGSTTGDPSTAV
ncbi:MAG: hypothetical protein AVDCRST_MAG49-1671, partial [uncultured Thermomicrobiales bacterium]